jgi:hypothetical protein
LTDQALNAEGARGPFNPTHRHALAHSERGNLTGHFLKFPDRSVKQYAE